MSGNGGCGAGTIGHVWTAPPVQGFSLVRAHGRVRSCVRPVRAVLMTAGPDEVPDRVPIRFPRLVSALTVAGLADPVVDRSAITSKATLALGAHRGRDGSCGEPVRFASGQESPDDPCRLVGQGHRRDLAWLLAQEPAEPWRRVVRSAGGLPEHRLGAENQQSAQIGMAHLGDAAEPLTPPYELCRGTRPSHAANSRAERKALASGMVAASAVAVIGPTPGTFSRRCTPSSSVERRRISRSSSAVSASNTPRRARPSSTGTALSGMPNVPPVRSIVTSLRPCCAPFGTTTPNSARCARRALIRLVRCRTNKSRARWISSIACCASPLMGTNRIEGRGPPRRSRPHRPDRSSGGARRA